MNIRHQQEDLPITALFPKHAPPPSKDIHAKPCSAIGKKKR